MTWKRLDTKLITLSPPEAPPPVGWVQLAKRYVTLSPLEIPPVWTKLDTRTITLIPKEEAPVGWIKLDTRIITLTPTEAPPLPPEYELIFSHEYPLGKTYIGRASEGTSTFNIPLPDQLFPNAFVIDRIVSAFEAQVKEQGEQMLDLKIYIDTSPIWKTNFIIKSTCTTSSPFPWAVVIIGILAIILVFAIKDLVTVSKDIDWGKPAEVITRTGLIILGIVGAGVAIAFIVKKKKGMSG